jgi:flagellar protein FliO/FliZ
VRSYKKKFFIFFACLLGGVICAPAQEEQVAPLEQSQTASSSREAERAIILNSAPVQDAVPAPEPPSTVWLFVRMILVLAAVIGCIYAAVFFLKKGRLKQMDDDPFLKRTASLVLSPGKSVQVITLGDNAYLVGVTDNAFTLLGKIDDKDLINAMNLNAEENATPAKPRDFASLLSIFTGQVGQRRQNAAQTPGAVSDSVKQTADFLRGQRSRINRENPQ